MGRNKEIVEIRGRESSPANSHSNKSNIRIIKVFLTPEEFEEAVKKEDEDMKNYPTMVYKRNTLRKNEVKIRLP